MPRIPTYLKRAFRPITTLLMGSSVSQSSAVAAPIGSSLPNPPPASAKHAYFAAGCFWGTESAFRRRFPLTSSNSGLIDTRVGYIGGATASPTYLTVGSGTTGHAEALEVLYDPEKLNFFFRMHDPCDAGGQGPDRGSQYRSAIFVEDEREEKVANEVKKRVQERWFANKTVVTEIVRRGPWWNAEEYHQLYLDKNPNGYECPSHFVRNYPTVLDTPIKA
ncbi:peptide methionine sulfoxide reductase MsrA [Kalaharituber pfeilii]|nr:peptide methionine sulfoxide reductase MsrA [Kalaharituber pfeilii]